MNVLEIFVFGIIAVCALVGYITGFLRTIYSLFAGVLVLAFVTWATPQVTVFLEENTGFGQIVQDKCVDYIQEIAREKISAGAGEYQKELQSGNEGLQSFLPKELVEEIAGYAANTAGDVLEETGIYEEIAGVVSHYIIEGLAFLFMMIVGGVLIHWIAHVLDLAARFPALKGPNKIMGAVLGATKGLFLVWIIFFVLTMLGGGTQNPLLSYIEESRALHFLYQNNILLWIIMGFMK